MNLADRALSALHRMLPAEEGSAHCDIPCGIYDPHNAQVAAHTVIRMVQLIEALPPSSDGGTAEKNAANQSFGRYVAVKEEHAKIAEHELVVLWSDYFKPEHLEKFPDLHDTFWKATKLTSTVKQQIDMKASQDLLASCQRIAEIFWATKGVKTRRLPSNQPSGGEIVYPEPA